MKQLTIITPTYNRKGNLELLYESLKNQTNKCFEWLIIDDGSTDDTVDFIKYIQKHELSFSCRYLSKMNGGKHTALNLAFAHKLKEWAGVVDSDDWLEKDCVNTILQRIKECDESIGCILTHRKYPSGEINGDLFIEGCFSYLSRAYRNIQGDKFEVYRSELLKGYKFPVFEQERFMAESPLHMHVGKVTKTDFFNYAGYVGDYLDKGLTKNSVMNRYRCPNSTLYVYYNRYVSLKFSKAKVKSAINWWRFRLSYKGGRLISKDKAPLIYLPIGALFYLYDIIKKRAV